MNTKTLNIDPTSEITGITRACSTKTGEILAGKLMERIREPRRPLEFFLGDQEN